MITKFKLFENTDINIELDLQEDLMNRLISNLSFIIYKGKKRDEKKNKNYKSLRIKSIGGYCEDNKVQYTDISDGCLIKIEMTNKDNIEAKYSKVSDLDSMKENSISVEINGKLVYDLNNEGNDMNSFLDMIGKQYRRYLEDKKWKIR